MRVSEKSANALKDFIRSLKIHEVHKKREDLP